MMCRQFIKTIKERILSFIKTKSNSFFSVQKQYIGKSNADIKPISPWMGIQEILSLGFHFHSLLQ